MTRAPRRGVGKGRSAVACREVLRALHDLAPGDDLAGDALAHLEVCEECSSIARRSSAIRERLAERPPLVVPGADFSARVLEQLPAPTEVLAWAALRLLPAAIALVLVLSWLSVTAVDSRELLFDPLDDAVVMTFPTEHAP